MSKKKQPRIDLNAARTKLFQQRQLLQQAMAVKHSTEEAIFELEATIRKLEGDIAAEIVFILPVPPLSFD